MAKKRKSTPLPKAPAAKEAKQLIEPTRIDRLLGRNPNQEQTRHEREAAVQRLIVMSVVAAAVVIGILLVIAFVVDGIVRPSQNVATVSGESISVGDYQQRVRIERALQIELINDALNDIVEENGVTVDEAGNFVLQQQPYATYWSELNTSDVMGLRVLDDMVDDKLIAAAAAELGVTVTDEDVQAYIDDLIGYDPEAVALIGTDPTATPEPTITPTPFVSPTPTTEPTATTAPTATPTIEGATPIPTATATVTPAPTEAVPTRSAEEVRTQFENQKQSFISEVARLSGASESAVLDVIRARALRKAVADHLSGSAEDETLYADARHILVETEEQAQDIIAALEGGESFGDLARAASTDTGSGANGGELGWAPVSNYVEPFANAVRDAEIGAIVGPVESEFGYHIIQVRAKENREATEAEIERAKDLVLTDWIDEVRTAAEGSYETTNAWASNIPQSPNFIYHAR
ncbi:MAG: peptidylprolyl isomerase [Anaerolineae bacterium]|nr:Chaperone SurA [Anaerolineae bacterium]MBW7878322.1 peptidylprolyl isomerase [Anaerolineae bacterium]